MTSIWPAQNHCLPTMVRAVMHKKPFHWNLWLHKLFWQGFTLSVARNILMPLEARVECNGSVQ